MKNQQSKRDNKKPDSNSTKFTCFDCGKQRHMKVDCPSLVNKKKGHMRRTTTNLERQKSIHSLERQCYFFQ